MPECADGAAPVTPVPSYTRLPHAVGAAEAAHRVTALVTLIADWAEAAHG